MLVNGLGSRNHGAPNGEQLARSGDVVGAGAAGEKAVAADAVEALRTPAPWARHHRQAGGLTHRAAIRIRKRREREKGVSFLNVRQRAASAAASGLMALLESECGGLTQMTEVNRVTLTARRSLPVFSIVGRPRCSSAGLKRAHFGSERLIRSPRPLISKAVPETPPTPSSPPRDTTSAVSSHG